MASPHPYAISFAVGRAPPAPQLAGPGSPLSLRVIAGSSPTRSWMGGGWDSGTADQFKHQEARFLFLR